VIGERNGRPLLGVFRNETDSLTFIPQRAALQTEFCADEAKSWNQVYARFAPLRLTIRKPTVCRGGLDEPGRNIMHSCGVIPVSSRYL